MSGTHLRERHHRVGRRVVVFVVVVSLLVGLGLGAGMTWLLAAGLSA